MVTKEINDKSSELIIVVTSDEKSWKDAQDKAFKKLHKKLTVKGFRKGHVPLDIAKKSIQQNDAWTDGVKGIIDQMAKEAATAIGKDTQILAGPVYSIDKISETELSIKFTYPIYPKIKLGDYKKHGVKLVVGGISDKDVDYEIKQLQEKHSLLKSVDRAIVKGDYAKFDFEGFVDGVAFDGGKAKDYELEIGSGKFIKGFEEQMIGLKKGGKKDVEVSFPKQYHVEALKSKPAIFKVVIKSVMSKELPRLDDSLAKDAKIVGVKTLNDLRGYFKDKLKVQKEASAKVVFQREVLQKVIEKSQINLPLRIVAREVETIEKNFVEKLAKQGLDKQKYLKLAKMEEKQLRDTFVDQAKARLNDAFVMAEITKAEKIEIKDSDYENEYKKLAKTYQRSENETKKTIKKEQLQEAIINEKVVDKLIAYSNAK